MSIRSAMKKIYAKYSSGVKHFVDEDETNYETDEINKGNMSEFCIFIAEQKSENTKHKTKYRKQTLFKFCRKKNEKRKVQDVLFPKQNIKIKENNGVYNCNSCVFSTKHSVQGPKARVGEGTNLDVHGVLLHAW